MSARTTKKVLVGMAAASLLVVTNSIPAQAANDTIGFSPISLSIEAMVGLEGGIKAIGAANGLDVVTADPNFDLSKAKTNIENWVTNKTVKGFWSIVAGNGAVLKSTLEKAQAAGIVAIVNGVPADYGFTGLQKGIAFAQIPYAQQADAMAKAMSTCLKARGKSAGNVILGLNAAGTPGKAEQEKAFIASLKKYAPNAKIVKKLMMVGDKAKQQSTARSAIQSNPTVVGLATWTDEGSLGAAAAFKSAGKKASNTCVVGAGGGAAAVKAVKAKSVWMVSALDFQGDTYQSVMALKAMIANPTAVGKQLYTPIKVTKQ